MNEKKQKLSLFSGSDWESRGGELVVVATSVADAARLLELACRARRGATPEKMAEPVEKIDIGRNSRWIKVYFGRDDNFSSCYGGKIVHERGVWHSKPNAMGMSEDKFVRLV